MQFINLRAQQQKIKPEIDTAIARVLEHGQYIMGPEIGLVEQQLADFCGVKHAITCASGTDALVMALLSKKLDSTDAIFVPTYTFAATAEAVVWSGAQPVFIDCLPDTYNIDPNSLSAAIKLAKKRGLNPVGIIPVDLFGQPVDYNTIGQIAKDNDLWIIADSAQSFGATYYGKKVGNLADITTTSFFPAKPLGCYGDGGAIFTNDDQTADILKSIRIHGHGPDPTQYVRVGINGRFDTIQAAILIEKLKVFPEELEARQQLANTYSQGLQHIVNVPTVDTGNSSAWAQYTIKLPEGVERSCVIQDLKQAGVPTAIYYPWALHQQPVYKKYLTATGGSLPVSEGLITQVFSLPMSGYVTQHEAKQVVSAVTKALECQKEMLASVEII